MIEDFRLQIADWGCGMKHGAWGFVDQLIRELVDSLKSQAKLASTGHCQNELQAVCCLLTYPANLCKNIRDQKVHCHVYTMW